MGTIEEKQALWRAFGERTERLLRKGSAGLRELSGSELNALLDDYQRVAADLARARSMGAPRATTDLLNRLTLAGHNLLYGFGKPEESMSIGLLARFALAVRASAWSMLLSAALFFIPAFIAYFAVQASPDIGYDLVPESFYDFNPARDDNLHDIPSLARPMTSSAIVTNNIQVVFLAWGLGLTAGLGTAYILITNGIHIGIVAGWMTIQGHERALWGWIMPHGGTELLAICLAGGAGFLFAGAILAPGLAPRAEALKKAGRRSLEIVLGCMVMLLFAGLIEGFVSPSELPYPARLLVLLFSLALWVAYFLGAGRVSRAGNSA